MIHAVDVVPCRHFPRHEEGGEKEARRAETEEKKEERRKRLMIGEARFVEKWEEGMIKRRRRVKERKWRGMKKKKILDLHLALQTGDVSPLQGRNLKYFCI